MEKHSQPANRRAPGDDVAFDLQHLLDRVTGLQEALLEELLRDLLARDEVAA